MLTLETEKHSKTAVIFMVGALDLDGIRSLKDKIQELRKAGFINVVLDFSKVVTIKSSVLSELLTPLRALTIMQGQVGLCGMTVSTHRVMKTAPFYKSMKAFETKEDAVQAFEAA